MRNQIVAAAKGRKIVPASDYSYYSMHQTSGLVLTDQAPATQQLLGDLTLTGTASWSDGKFVPQGDHKQRYTSTAVSDACRLDNLSNQLIVALDIYGTSSSFTDATCDTNTNTTVNMDDTSSVKAGMKISGTDIPASTTVVSVDSGTAITISQAATGTSVNVTLTFGMDSETIFYFGVGQAGYGAWTINLISSGVVGRVAVQHYSAVDGAVTDAQNSDNAGNVLNGSTHTVFLMLDAKNLGGGLFVDGAQEGVDLILGSTSADLCAANTVRGLSVFCKSTNDAGTAWQTSGLGATSAGLTIDQIFITRTTSDQSANMGALALAWHNKPSRELPDLFHGL